MSHLSDFTIRTLKRLFTEQVARTSTKFTTNYIFIQAVVTVNTHMADACLRTFGNTHFQINRVIVDVDFYRVKMEEYVTVVIIVVSDSIFIARCTFTQ